MLIFQHNYPTISLSSIGSPVHVIERTILDLEVVESIDSVLLEEESLVSDIEDE